MDDRITDEQVRRGHGAATVVLDPVAPTQHQAWYERPCLFQDVGSAEQLQALVSGEHNEKLVVVDFFAGWCSSCKGAFPNLCKIPKDDKLSKHFNFYKANAEDEGIFWWVKKNQVTALPYLAVYNSEGRLLIGMSASHKKMAQVKAALHTIADNPQAARFTMDPQGNLVAHQ